MNFKAPQHLYKTWERSTSVGIIISYYNSLTFSSWFRILISLEHVMCRATFCNVTLARNFTLWLRHSSHAAHAARSSVIKRNKKCTDFFISVLSQGTAKLTKGTKKTQFVFQPRLINDFAYHMGKILFWSFGNYRDLSLCGDAQAICRLHTVSFCTFFVTHLADYIFYLLVYVFIYQKQWL